MKHILSHPLFLAITSVFFAVATYAYQFMGAPIVADTTKWSEFGGYIGGVLGPAFSLVSVWLLLRTLETQREQLEASNAALQEAADYQKEQQALMRKQSFEQTFFTWLHSYRDMVNAITSESNGKKLWARSALKWFWKLYMMDQSVLVAAGVAGESINDWLVRTSRGITLSPEEIERIGIGTNLRFQRCM